MKSIFTIMEQSTLLQLKSKHHLICPIHGAALCDPVLFVSREMINPISFLLPTGHTVLWRIRQVTPSAGSCRHMPFSLFFKPVLQAIRENVPRRMQNHLHIHPAAFPFSILSEVVSNWPGRYNSKKDPFPRKICYGAEGDRGHPMENIQRQPVRAVVLGGGGARGAYEVGVWQAMTELGMDYQVVTGTSVGALNGALMVQQNLEGALHLWNHLDNSDVMKNMPDLTADKNSRLEIYRSFFRQVMREGGVDTSPLARLVKQLVDEQQLRRSSRELGIVTVDVSARRALELFLPEIPQGHLADYLLASAACFPFLQSKEIGGATFVDGGYTNNIPINLALRARQTPEEIIAVDVEGKVCGIEKDSE